MPLLNGGSVAAFTGSMAEVMENELKAEYQAVFGEAMPDGDADEQRGRRMLFVAIARGMLKYLEAHQNEFMTGITLSALDDSWQQSYHVHATDLNM